MKRMKKLMARIIYLPVSLGAALSVMLDTFSRIVDWRFLTSEGHCFVRRVDRGL